jgi:hypothetical protein
MILRHATPARNVTSILRSGLLSKRAANHVSSAGTKEGSPRIREDAQAEVWTSCSRLL